MARGRNSHHGTGGGAIHACDRLIARAEDEKKSVKSVQARIKMIASATRLESDIAKVLKESDPNADEFLQSCHNRLKSIAEGNAKRMYEIDNCVDAMREAKTDVQRRQNNQQGGGEEGADEEEEVMDYERYLHEALESIRDRQDKNPSRVAPEDHDLVRELREELGEKVPKKRARASRGGGGDDDDDDLEIVRGEQDDVHALKCPFTGMLFEDPVKNTQCGHVYGRAGFQQLIRLGKKTCPIPGCTNNNVSLSQVEEDEEMILRVRRHKQKEELEKKKRELEEDDEDDQEGAGFTVL